MAKEKFRNWKPKDQIRIKYKYGENGREYVNAKWEEA